MTRQLADWLPAYLNYTTGTEAPQIMHFWSGVSAIAACLRRKVWMDMKRFKWYPNFYVILVAPPGIISKTTTMDLSMDLVRKVPGIKFGPDVVTWQALVTKFAESREEFLMEDTGEWVPMSPVTLASGELGNLINPQDREMVNLFIALWDGRAAFEKITKGSGVDVVSAPWINMIGCTTPHWIADNMPQATIGGGFTSRCIFVYGEKKENFVALPDEHLRPETEALAGALASDLEHISLNLVGPMTLSEPARAWIRAWYAKMWGPEAVQQLDDDRLDGYLARKQTHMMKLAMVLSVSESDSLEITDIHVQLADKMLERTEQDLEKVFSRIGRSEESMQVERFITFIRRYGRVSFTVAYKYIHSYFTDYRDFDAALAGAVKSGQIKLEYQGGTTPECTFLVYTGA